MSGPAMKRAAPLAVLKAFAALRRSMSLYPDGHAIVEQNATELERAVSRGLNEAGRLRIDVIGGTAHVDGYPFRIESQSNRELIDELEAVGVDSLQIESGADARELLEAAKVLNEVRDRSEGPGSLRSELVERGVTRVTMSKLLPVGMRRGNTADGPMLPPAPRDTGYAEALESARESVGSVFEGGSPDARAVRGLLDRLGDQIVDRRSALAEILAVKRYENHTYYHSMNVASLSVLLGRRLGLTQHTLEVLAEAALLHDVGKRSIPTEIINKAGPLNRREWRIMQRHPVTGAEILATNPDFSPISATVALEHHRGFVGGGYPDLGDARPHFISQIVAVTDTYEALTGARAYRAPLIPDEACLILASMAGNKLNPAVVRAFVSLVTFFPLGSVVRTSAGEVGVVVDTAEREPLHPTIFTIEHPGATGRSGMRIDTAERNRSGEYARHIVEAIPERGPTLPPEAWREPSQTIVSTVDPGPEPKVAMDGGRVEPTVADPQISIDGPDPGAVTELESEGGVATAAPESAGRRAEEAGEGRKRRKRRRGRKRRRH
ncbi:MAG: HD-GYP domain-containing protein [Gemmatimonadetes bacterium]|nr:HD-GYP domain-containing protein [Gemmatimonadota bacterium]